MKRISLLSLLFSVILVSTALADPITDLRNQVSAADVVKVRAASGLAANQDACNNLSIQYSQDASELAGMKDVLSTDDYNGMCRQLASANAWLGFSAVDNQSTSDILSTTKYSGYTLADLRATALYWLGEGHTDTSKAKAWADDYTKYTNLAQSAAQSANNDNYYATSNLALLECRMRYGGGYYGY